MSKKKKRKSKLQTPTIILEKDPWINDLKKYELNDEDWSCYVCIAVEKNEEYSTVVDMFNESCKDGLTWAVKCVSHKVLVNLVEDNYRKEDMSPMTALAKELRDEMIARRNTFANTELTASLVKYHILALKEIDIQRKIEENENEKLSQERWLRLEDDIEPIKAVGVSIKNTTVDKKKAVEKKKSKEKVKLTKLTRRGQVRTDLVYSNDRPNEGPDLYVILTGLYDPHLIKELIKIGVPVLCVLELDYETAENPDTKLSNLTKMKEYITKIPRVYNLSLHPSSFTRDRLVSHFWKTFNHSFRNPDEFRFYENTFSFTHKINIDPIPTDNGLILNFPKLQKMLYKDIRDALFKLHDLVCFHFQYLENLTHIPLPTSEYTEITSYSFYNKVLDSIPCESITIPIILDTMVHQVCEIPEGIDDYQEMNELFHLEEPIELKDELYDNMLRKTFMELNEAYGIFEEELPIPEEIIPTFDNQTDQNLQPARKSIDLTKDGNNNNLSFEGDITFDDSVSKEQMMLDNARSDKGNNLNPNIGIMINEKAYSATSEYVKYHRRDTTSSGESKMRRGSKHVAIINNSDKITDKSYGSKQLATFVLNRYQHMMNTFFDNQKWKSYMDCMIENADEKHISYHYKLLNNFFNINEKKSSKLLDIMLILNNLDLMTEKDSVKHGKSCVENESAHRPIKCELSELTSPKLGGKNSYFLENFQFYEEMEPNVLKQNLYTSICTYNSMYSKFLGSLRCTVLKLQDLEKEMRIGVLPTRLLLRDFVEYFFTKEYHECVDKVKKMLLHLREIPIEMAPHRIDEPLVRPIRLDEESLIDFRDFIMPTSTQEEQYDKLGDIEYENGKRLKEELKKFEEMVQATESEAKALLRSAAGVAYELDVENLYQVQFLETERIYNFCKKLKMYFRHYEQLYHRVRYSLINKLDGHTLKYDYNKDDSKESLITLTLESGIIFCFTEEERAEKWEEGEMDSGGETHEEDARLTGQTLVNFKLSCPSGLLIQPVLMSDSKIYFKQTYIQRPHSGLKGEKYRCNLDSGTVLRFMDNEDIEILQINGCITLCKSFGNKTPLPSKPPSTENLREFVINNYTLISSDGKVSSFIDEIQHVQEPLFMQEFRDLHNDTIITERSDGTVMTHYNDGSRLVVYPDGTEIKTYVEISTEEIVCEPSLSEICDKTSIEMTKHIITEDFDNFFYNFKDTLEIGDLKLEITEGFTVINIIASVHHPKFASFRYDPNRTEFELGLSKSCKVRVSENGRMKIEIGDNVSFKIDAETATLTKSEGEESVYWRLVRLGGGEDSPFCMMEDSSGVWATLSREGEFKSSKYQPCFDSETYSVYRGLRGMKFFDEGTAQKYLDAGITHKYFTPEITDFIVLYPPKGKDAELPSKKPLPLLPSTYGDDWLFPFQNGKKGPVKMVAEKEEMSPSTLIACKFHKAQCGDEAINRFQDMLTKYQKFLTLDDGEVEEGVEEMEPVDREEPLEEDNLLELYLRGPSESKTQDKEVEKYLREKILLHLTKVGLTAMANRRDYKQYLFHRKAIVNMEIPNYFDSPLGAVALLTIEVGEGVGKEIEGKYKDQEERLLTKPLSEFTQEDVDILEDLLTSGEHPFWSKNPSPYTMREVLEAGRELSKYFPTMRDVLMQSTQPPNCHFTNIAEINITELIRTNSKLKK